MNKTIYAVFHAFDVDGGFGDAIGEEEFVFATEDKELAEAYVQKYSDPHVYDTPYEDLVCGELFIKEINTITPDLSIPPWEFDTFWPR